MPAAPAAASFPGPSALGRGVVVDADQPAPPGLERVRRVVIDDEVIAHPAAAAAVLHLHWVRRVPVVIELAVANEALREPETCDLAPYALDPGFGFDRERLHFLVWANTYDHRRSEPVWWHGVLATRRSDAVGSATADVALPDGTHHWVDGGPRGPVAGDDGRPLPLIHRESVQLGRITPLGDTSPRLDLAPDQLAAVTHASGPARIIAPAGSGKTRVLIARLRHLLSDRGYEPSLTTAVAYNTRAAAEMRRRLDGLRANVRTLHSLALWICNRVDERRIVHERDVRAILDELVRVGRVPNTDPFQPYLDALAEVRLGLRPPAAVEAARDDVEGFADVFADFRRILDERRLLDFDEQIYRAIELLLTRPDLRREVQRRCTHLLVDEFQDLTPAFLLLIRLVAAPSLQVFAVGDDDQTIYSYSGASPRFLIEFDRYFPGAGAHALEVNYRCPPDVVAAAGGLLRHNRVRVAKTIRAGRAPAAGAAPALSVHRVAAGAMAERAVHLIGDWLSDGGAAAEVAVLTRVNSALLPVQVALGEAGIARTAPLDVSVLQRTGIRTALAYLRIGLDPERIRREDVLETLNRPARKVKGAVAPLLRRARRLSLTRLGELCELLDGQQAERLEGYVADLRALTDAITGGADTARCLEVIRRRIGLGEAMDTLDASHTRPEGSGHADDLDALSQLAELHPDTATFQGWLTERLRDPGDPAGVTLSTVHRVKGMEWDRVVVFAANQGLFPHRLADDVEEERRVLHVAVTRCRTQVAVVANRDATTPFAGQLRPAAPGTADRPADDTPAGGHAAGPARDEDGDASAPAAVDPAATGRPGPASGVPAGAARLLDGRVSVEPGAAITVPGGFAARVVAVDGDGARVAIALDGDEPVEVALAYGTAVGFTDGAGALAPAPRIPRHGAPAGPIGDDDRGAAVDGELLSALRSWRTRTATAAGMPAYIVLHDRHLEAIARRRPRTVRELAACPGIGPTKLDRYADDILAVVTAAPPPTA